MDSIRIDKWLWAARFYKTRSLATEEVGKGRVHIAQQEVKPSREVRVGDTVALSHAGIKRTVVVKAISGTRGSAPIAQTLYEETPQSIQDRAAAAEHRRLNAEPAHTITQGRPTKRDRRDLQKGLNARWSASIDDLP
jgi:ribosome-associated heat shock protein Hsp15